MKWLLDFLFLPGIFTVWNLSGFGKFIESTLKLENCLNQRQNQHGMHAAVHGVLHGAQY